MCVCVEKVVLVGDVWLGKRGVRYSAVVVILDSWSIKVR